MAQSRGMSPLATRQWLTEAMDALPSDTFPAGADRQVLIDRLTPKIYALVRAQQQEALDRFRRDIGMSSLN